MESYNMEILKDVACGVGAFLLPVIVFAIVFFLVNWFDKKINGTWEERIERVGTTKIKQNAGYYDVYVYNYYYRADEVDISSGFHWEYRGSEYTEELAKKKAACVSKMIKRQFAEWRKGHRIV